jgi:hypothetical protein
MTLGWACAGEDGAAAGRVGLQNGGRNLGHMVARLAVVRDDLVEATTSWTSSIVSVTTAIKQSWLASAMESGLAPDLVRPPPACMRYAGGQVLWVVCFMLPLLEIIRTRSDRAVDRIRTCPW